MSQFDRFRKRSSEQHLSAKPPGDCVQLSKVVNVVAKIDSPPNQREQPNQNDLVGPYDFWFDGGACRIVTGYTEYLFTDGTLATVPTTSILEVKIEFHDGQVVRVSQQK